MDIQRFHSNARMSKVVVHGDTIYMSGQVADDPKQDFEGQLQQILDRIDEQLKEQGVDRTRLLSVNIWIDDYRKWPRLNAVWEKWIPADHKPVRTCVEARLAFPEYQVEVAVIAAR